MPNMSYCRFENTLNDLRDCLEHWEDAESESEKKAKQRMLKLMLDFTEDFREDIED